MGDGFISFRFENKLEKFRSMPSAIRVRERFPGTDIERYATFIGESLKKTKAREFVPSQEEIAALLVRQEMSTTVYCHGGGSCKISINSHTTAGEVRFGYIILQAKSRDGPGKRQSTEADCFLCRCRSWRS